MRVLATKLGNPVDARTIRTTIKIAGKEMSILPIGRQIDEVVQKLEYRYLRVVCKDYPQMRILAEKN